MNQIPPIIALTPSAILRGSLNLEPFHLWLDVQQYDPVRLQRVTKICAGQGCKLILVSGQNCADIHDDLDDFLAEIGFSQIFTIWDSRNDMSAAEDFLFMNLQNDNSVLRLVTSMSDNEASELGSIGRVMVDLEKVASTLDE